MAIVTCGKCGAKNRVDENRTGTEKATCGRCGAELSLSKSDGAVITITDASFSNDLASAGLVPVLVDCWATWCPPCRAIAPTIDQLATEAAGRYRVGKLNVDENPRVATEFKIESIPTLLIFKSGKLVDRLALREEIGEAAADEHHG